MSVSSLRVAVGSPGGREVCPAVASALTRVTATLQEAGSLLVGPPPDWLDEARRITEAYWARSGRTGAQIDQDLFDWDRFRRRVMLDTTGIDVIITPTVADTAPLHREMRTEDYPFCLPASLTGAPAITVPVGSGAVQVIARRWQDHVAAAVALAIESSAK